MATAIITLKIMPESPEADLELISREAQQKIIDYAGDTERRVSQEPIAFGLIAVKIIFVFDDKIGGTDKLEEEIGKIEGVNSVEVIDIRRAIG